MPHITLTKHIFRPIFRTLDYLTPVGDLLARLWIAKIFFMSGLTKIENLDCTRRLFENVYHVPLLPPICAAYLGTAAELTLPVLLLFGLGGRLTILCFFIYNIICVISFSFLWTPEGQVGLDNHINWGLLLMMLMFHGPGKISLDYWIRKRFIEHL
ncbi:MAG: DoxX family protein [Gammaproteobacteria bacterium]|nr:DoxX family protein [Gammaproteobacteria bacterium]